MSQTSLITEAARQALLAAIAQLNIDIDTHIQGGIDRHDSQVILDTPFIGLNGEQIATKTLKIGVTINNINAFILLPAIPL